MLENLLNLYGVKIMQGWKFLISAIKAHYFIEGRSMCGSWLTFGNEFEDKEPNINDMCKNCMKKAAKVEGVTKND